MIKNLSIFTTVWRMNVNKFVNTFIFIIVKHGETFRTKSDGLGGI
jgi:hypothetical protein